MLHRTLCDLRLYKRAERWMTQMVSVLPGLRRRGLSTLVERIRNLTPAIDIDPLTRRPLRPVDDAHFLPHLPPGPLPQVVSRFHADLAVLRYLRPSLRPIPVTLEVQLALSEKQLARLPEAPKLTLPPHPFKAPRKVLAIVPPEGDFAEQARAAGADIVGDLDIIPSILDDTYEHGLDFDVLVCHKALSKDITALRKKLDRLYPVGNRRTLGDDVPGMVALHRSGQYYQYSRSDPLFSTEVGCLPDSASEHIIDNVQHFLECVRTDCRSIKASQPIASLTLKCPPSHPQQIDPGSFQ